MSSGRGRRSSSCEMVCSFQFRRCIHIVSLPYFISLCMSNIIQAKLKLKSLRLHDAHLIQKWFGFSNKCEALICMLKKLKGLRRLRFYILNNVPLYRGLKLLIDILNDQLEAVAYCPLVLSNGTEGSKCVFYGKNKIRHRLSKVVQWLLGEGQGHPSDTNLPRVSPSGPCVSFQPWSYNFPFSLS